MSIIQFLRIIWARRWIVAAAAISSVIGAIIVMMILPPRWDAHSRVLLGLLKPDPVTGQIISGPAARSYIDTQTELIKDYAVAGQVADQLGWLSDPGLIQQYQNRPKSDVRDYRRWLAQIVIDRTKTSVVQGSNILDITYTATQPEQAAQVAEALRKAFIDTSLAFRRDDANRNADWFAAQAEKNRVALNAAETAKSDYERANGIVMADDKTDVDTARLRALTQAGGVAAVAPMAVAATSSPASIELAQVDSQIDQESKVLGPNHPELVALRNRRAALAQVAAQDMRAARAAASASASASSASAGALNRQVIEQTSRVLAKSDKIQKLNQLQAEVDLRREQYEKAAGRSVELRQEGAIADVGLTPLGSAVVPQSPSFPKKPLIIGGSLGLGMVVGLLVALLMELISRRVRGAEDLKFLFIAPLLAVIGPPIKPQAAGRRGAAFGGRQASKAVQA